MTPEVEETLKEICVGIEQRYEVRFVAMGPEENHVHILVQGIPVIQVTRMVTVIKSLTARGIFKRHPKIKKDIL